MTAATARNSRRSINIKAIKVAPVSEVRSAFKRIALWAVGAGLGAAALVYVAGPIVAMIVKLA